MVSTLTNRINENTSEKSAVLKDFASLASIKVLNLVLPLLTIPYLIRILGIENIGSINLATSIMSYGLVIIAFGFDYTGTKFISENSGNKRKVLDYYSSAMAIRFWLMLLSFILLFAIVWLVPRFYEIRMICFVMFGSVIGQYLTPVWVFQGLQKMKYLTLANMFSKVSYASMIFFFINVEDDYLLVPLFLTISSIISGGVLQLIISKKIKLRLQFMKFFDIYSLMKMISEGKNVFLQQVFSSMYGPITIMFLGGMATNIDVGFYTISEKILGIPIMLLVVAVQAYYPYAVKLYKRSENDYFNQMFRLIFAIVILMVLAVIFIHFFSVDIYQIVTGSNDKVGVEILKILSVGLMFSSLGQLFTQVFITLEQSEVLKRISFSIMIITLLSTPVIINYYGAVGLAYYTVFRQALVILTCMFFILFFYKEYKNV